MRDGTNYYQVRAQEVRAIALAIVDLKERNRVMRIADDYDDLAGGDKAKSGRK